MHSDVCDFADHICEMFVCILRFLLFPQPVEFQSLELVEASELYRTKYHFSC